MIDLEENGTVADDNFKPDSVDWNSVLMGINAKRANPNARAVLPSDCELEDEFDIDLE